MERYEIESYILTQIQPNQIKSNQDKAQTKIIGISIVRTAADLDDPVPLTTAYYDSSSSGFFQRQVSLGHCPSTRFFCNCSCTNHTGRHGPFSWKPLQTCYSCSFLTHLTLSHSTHSFHSLSISVGQGNADHSDQDLYEAN
jgi:hypothetical protein